MNAKEPTPQELYKQAYGRCKTSALWRLSDLGSDKYEHAAIKSRWIVNAINPMTFKQFIDCLEAAQTGRAYATRNHWFFIVDGDELQFTKEECARFARYFSEGFHMNLAQYSKIMKAGGCYINERLFEDDEVFPLKAKEYAYHRFIIRCCSFGTSSWWIYRHDTVALDAKFCALEDAMMDEIYTEQQADLQAEMSMQRIWRVGG